MSDHFLNLAPDPLTAARAHFLAERSAWAELFRFENWIWSRPRAGLFALETAFEIEAKKAVCDCSSPQKPCAHALGLALFFEKAGEAVFSKAADLPPFLNQFGQKGQQKALFQSEKAEPEPPAIDEKKDRLETFSAGIADLQTWLEDVARQGIAAFSTEQKPFDTIAARMGDAKMSSLARRLRLLNSLSTASPTWAEDVSESLGDFFVAVKMFEKLEIDGGLTEGQKADLAAWLAPVAKDLALKIGPTERDSWAVFGQSEIENERLRERCVWLRGERTGRWALILDYAFGDQPFPEIWRTGERATGDLAFFPAAEPLRALPKKLEAVDEKLEKWPDLPLFESFLNEFAQVLGKSVFQKTWPVAVSEAVPFFENERFGIVDSAQNVVWLDCSAAVGWAILAVSGGAGIGLFGVWNGEKLAPLSVFDGEKLIAFKS